jgi:hypothetical protein
LSGVNLNARVISILEWPTRRSGRERFAPGDAVELPLAFVSHGQAYRTKWKG